MSNNNQQTPKVPTPEQIAQILSEKFGIPLDQLEIHTLTEGEPNSQQDSTNKDDPLNHLEEKLSSIQEKIQEIKENRAMREILPPFKTQTVGTHPILAEFTKEDCILILKGTGHVMRSSYAEYENLPEDEQPSDAQQSFDLLNATLHMMTGLLKHKRSKQNKA